MASVLFSLWLAHSKSLIHIFVPSVHQFYLFISILFSNLLRNVVKRSKICLIFGVHNIQSAAIKVQYSTCTNTNIRDEMKCVRGWNYEHLPCQNTYSFANLSKSLSEKTDVDSFVSLLLVWDFANFPFWCSAICTHTQAHAQTHTADSMTQSSTSNRWSGLNDKYFKV